MEQMWHFLYIYITSIAKIMRNMGYFLHIHYVKITSTCIFLRWTRHDVFIHIMSCVMKILRVWEIICMKMSCLVHHNFFYQILRIWENVHVKCVTSGPSYLPGWTVLSSCNKSSSADGATFLVEDPSIKSDWPVMTWINSNRIHKNWNVTISGGNQGPLQWTLSKSLSQNQMCILV